MSLRWRLTIWYVLASLITLAALFFAVRRLTGSLLMNDLDSDLADATHTASTDLANVPLSDTRGLEQLVREPRSVSLGPGRLIVIITDPQGKVLASSPGAPAASLQLSPTDLTDISHGNSVTESLTPKGMHKIRIYAAGATAPDGGAVILTAAPTSSVDAAVSRFEAVLTVVVAVGGLVSIVVAYVIARGGLRPLQKVVDVAAATEASALLDRRIAARNQPAEVQRLADTFDAMLDRLQRAFEQQRNFVGDVSHELRTPLTALQGNVDVLLMDPGLDPEVRGQLERIAADTSRLSRLVTNLLYLASAEAGRQPDLRPVEMDVVLLDVYREQRGRRPDVRLRLAHEDQARVMGDRDLLKLLVTNLVENALKYSRPGGEVTLSLSRDDSRADVEVVDSGPGIAPEDLPHIFERFYRGRDSARVGGTGLGLAIAHWAATVHSGTIEVESEPGRGSTFRVRLPLVQPVEVPLDEKSLTQS